MERFFASKGPLFLIVASFLYVLSFSFPPENLKIFFIIGAFIFAAFDLFFIIRGDQKKLSLIAFFLVVISLVLFSTRQFLDLPLDTVIRETAILPKIRTVLLFAFLTLLTSGIFLRVSIELLGLNPSSSRRDRMLRSIVSLITVVLAIVMLNGIVSQRNVLFDLSPGYFSFRDGSRVIIHSIQDKIQIYVFLPVQQATASHDKTLPDVYRIADDLRLMIDSLPSINSRIEIHYRNADLDEDRPGEFKNVTNGTIILRKINQDLNGPPYKERRVYVMNESDLRKAEREIVRSLISISTEEKKIYYSNYHGEATALERKPDGFDLLKEELRFYNYVLLPLNEATFPSIPQDAAAILIAGPRKKLHDEFKKNLLSFFNKGGRVLVLMNPEGEEDYNFLFSAWNSHYTFNKNILSIPQMKDVVITDSYSPHRITENIAIAGKGLLVFPGTGSFSAEPSPASSGENIQIKPIIFSPHVSFYDKNKNRKVDKDEPSGRLDLALAVESKQGGKAILYASYLLMSSSGLRFPVDQRNIILAADTMAYLTESNLAAGLKEEDTSLRNVQLTDEMRTFNMITGIILFPSIMAAGTYLLIFLYRKRKKFHEGL